MNRYGYSDLKIGQTESFSVRVGEEMFALFRQVTGDSNPLHSDKDFARSYGYPDRVAYGMLTASFLSTLAGVYLPGERSLIQSVEVKFLKPVYIGDELTVRGTVLELNDTVRQAVIRVDILNQDGGRVLRGKIKAGILYRGGEICR